MTKHAQVTQSRNFAISLPCLKNEVSDEGNFLHADEDESFLQIDTKIFDGDGRAFLNFPKQQVCNVFTISQNRS